MYSLWDASYTSIKQGFFFFKAITINRSIEESQTYLILEVLLINLYLYLIFAL